MSTTVTTTTATTTSSNGKVIPDPAPSGEVTAHLNFFVPPADGSVAQYLVDASPLGRPAENYGFEPVSVDISDIRGREDSFTLSDDAFAALKSIPSDATIDWESDDDIKAKYYPEVESLVRSNVPAAEKVVIFDHTIRLADPKAYRMPVLRAHVDQTPYSAAQRVRRHASEDLLKGRYRIINVWRPISSGPVASYPLAFVSGKSADKDDIVPIQHVYPDGYTGEHAGVKFNQRQKWYYWSGMTGDERLLLQCFDSSLSENGGRAPHVAFADPRTRADAEPRKSIEVRTLVFG